MGFESLEAHQLNFVLTVPSEICYNICIDWEIMEKSMTTKQQINNWFDRGVKDKATHMIVVCDTFDYDDYPVFILKTESVHEKVNYYRTASMQRVMEVYDLSIDKETQLNQPRANNY